jgi:hypothetical protein
MPKFKARATPPASPEAKGEEFRSEDIVPNTEQATSSDSLSNAAATFAEAITDAHHEAQKQYRAAWHTYVHALQGALAPDPLQEATRTFTAGVQKSLSNLDSREYLESARQFSAAAEQAQEKARTRVKDAYTKWVEEVQQVHSRNSGIQKSEFENYVKALQSAFSQADASQVDASTLARVGQAALAAAFLRAHLH